MFELIAQAVPTEWTAKDIMSLAGPAGIGGILMWYLYYETSVSRPKREELMRLEREAESNRTATTIRAIVEEFRTDSKEQRNAEHERAKVSAELARSGHAAMSNVVAAIGKLETTIQAMKN